MPVTFGVPWLTIVSGVLVGELALLPSCGSSSLLLVNV